jgi:hypothetical protein
MFKIPVKYILQKKFLAFFTVVPLLCATAFVKVDCPVCDGTGDMTNSLGMENVQIISLDTKEMGVMYHACGLFLMYGYDITLTIRNQGSQDAIGWVKMVLVDFVQSTPQDTQYTVVEVPTQSTQEIRLMLWFSSNHNQKLVTEVQAAVLTGKVMDDTCDGTGKVAANQYYLAKSLKEHIQQLYVAQVPWVPPQAWEWANDEDTGTSAFIGFYDPFAN